MYDRKKKKAIAILVILAVLMLLMGCEGQGIQKQTDPEELDTDLRLQQNIEEGGLSDKIAPEEPKQLEQSKEKEQLLNEEPGDQVQDKLDADRIIEEHYGYEC